MTTTKMGVRGRIAVAVAGILALAAATLGQVVDTAAQSSDSADAASSFTARANFWPTPLVENISCRTETRLSITRAIVSWNSPATAPLRSGDQYRYRVDLKHDDSSETETLETNTSATSIEVSNSWARRGKGWYLRVYTINGPKMSTGWQSQGIQMLSGGVNVQKCTGNNDGLPNPEGESLRVAGSDSETLASATISDDQAVLDPTTSVEPDENEAGPATERLTSESSSASTTSTRKTTSKSPSASASTTRRTTVSTKPTSTQATAASPSASPTRKTPTSAEPTSTSATAIPSPVPLPGGQEAEIVKKTRLVVSDNGSTVCTATVREGSSLRMTDGLLTVVDSTGTRVVDTETCDLT